MADNARRHHQHIFLYQCNKSPYPLREKRPGDIISIPFCMYLRGWHTICRWKHEEMWWAHDYTSSRQGHIRAVDRNIKTTEQAHASCVYATESHTVCGRNTRQVRKWSSFYAMGPRTFYGRQHEAPWGHTSAFYPMTYGLWEKRDPRHREYTWLIYTHTMEWRTFCDKRDTISTQFCINPTRYILSVGNDTSRHNQDTFLHLVSNETRTNCGKSTRQYQHSILRQHENMTYFLWPNTWRDTLRTHFYIDRIR